MGHQRRHITIDLVGGSVSHEAQDTGDSGAPLCLLITGAKGWQRSRPGDRPLGPGHAAGAPPRSGKQCGLCTRGGAVKQKGNQWHQDPGGEGECGVAQTWGTSV